MISTAMKERVSKVMSQYGDDGYRSLSRHHSQNGNPLICQTEDGGLIVGPVEQRKLLTVLNRRAEQLKASEAGDTFVKSEK